MQFLMTKNKKGHTVISRGLRLNGNIIQPDGPPIAEFLHESDALAWLGTLQATTALENVVSDDYVSPVSEEDFMATLQEFLGEEVLTVGDPEDVTLDEEDKGEHAEPIVLIDDNYKPERVVLVLRPNVELRTGENGYKYFVTVSYEVGRYHDDALTAVWPEETTARVIPETLQYVRNKYGEDVKIHHVSLEPVLSSRLFESLEELLEDINGRLPGAGDLIREQIEKNA